MLVSRASFACWIAAKHTHEVCHLLQMPECVLGHIVRQIAHKVHIEQVLEAPPTHCINMCIGYGSIGELLTICTCSSLDVCLAVVLESVCRLTTMAW